MQYDQQSCGSGINNWSWDNIIISGSHSHFLGYAIRPVEGFKIIMGKKKDIPFPVFLLLLPFIKFIYYFLLNTANSMFILLYIFLCQFFSCLGIFISSKKDDILSLYLYIKLIINISSITSSSNHGKPSILINDFILVYSW